MILVYRGHVNIKKVIMDKIGHLMENTKCDSYYLVQSEIFSQTLDEFPLNLVKGINLMAQIICIVIPGYNFIILI